MSKKVNKSVLIRKALKKGWDRKKIVETYKVSPQLVYIVARNEGLLKKKKKTSKITKAALLTKQELDALFKEPKKDPKAEAWRKKNTWFGVDEEKTAQALVYHEKLVNSGVDPKSDEYWKKINAKFAPDVVNNPPHYTDGGIDTLSYIEAKDLNYRLGNVVKYVSRAGKKVDSDPLQDLMKARFYLQREIDIRREA